MLRLGENAQTPSPKAGSMTGMLVGGYDVGAVGPATAGVASMPSTATASSRTSRSLFMVRILS